MHTRIVERGQVRRKVIVPGLPPVIARTRCTKANRERSQLKVETSNRFRAARTRHDEPSIKGRVD